MVILSEVIEKTCSVYRTAPSCVASAPVTGGRAVVLADGEDTVLDLTVQGGGLMKVSPLRADVGRIRDPRGTWIGMDGLGGGMLSGGCATLAPLKV